MISTATLNRYSKTKSKTIIPNIDAVWTSHAGVTVGNGSAHKNTTTLGYNNGNAFFGFLPENKIGELSCRVVANSIDGGTDADGFFYVGYSTQSTLQTSYGFYVFGVYLRLGVLRLAKGGNVNTIIGTYQVGDDVIIRRTTTAFECYKNNVLIHTESFLNYSYNTLAKMYVHTMHYKLGAFQEIKLKY